MRKVECGTFSKLSRMEVFVVFVKTGNLVFIGVIKIVEIGLIRLKKWRGGIDNLNFLLMEGKK